MQKFIPAVAAIGLLHAVAATAFGQAKVEDQVGSPVIDNAKYVISPQGGHLATVAPKGSRVNVVVDGVAGPRVDDVVQALGPIDRRPYKDLNVNSDWMPRGGQVTFSNDGTRYAYLARIGQEWVLMVDNKESFRLPVAGAVGAVSGVAGMAGNTDVRLEFTGESGKHLLFAKSTYNGYELWVDGRKWPGFFLDAGSEWDAITPIVSPDGEHVAYVAQIDREKRALIVDGKDAGYFGEHLQFTPDSKHLISVGTTPKGQAVLIDGKPFLTARQISRVYVPPAGNRLITALTHFSKDGLSAEGMFLLIDGKPVEATLTTRDGGITKVLISPDGKRYAAICGKTGNQFVVIDGKKGQEYSSIMDQGIVGLLPGIAWSADSSKVAYLATSVSGQFIVINDEESDALLNPWFTFSPDGKHVAYGGMANQGQKAVLMVDGKPVPLPPGPRSSVQNFIFSPDGSRHAFVSDQAVYLDGKNTGIGVQPQSNDPGMAFSPDGKHFGVRGGRAAEGKSGLFVDGQLVFSPNSSFQSLVRQAFSPDGQHLFWMTREPAAGAKAAPGNWEFVLYADGKVVTRCDADLYTPHRTGGEPFLRVTEGSSWAPSRGWNLNPAGKLLLIGPVDDDVKRHAITPAAESSVTSMIADIQAAEAKAIADAKAAKEKAEADKKAAAEAKVKADAGAAAKAKADYDAQVAAATKARADAQAKAKADYDARVAKQKADYDAAVAKRKADADAAAAARLQKK